MSNYRKLFKNIFVGLVGCPAVAQATPCKYSSVPNEVQRGEASDADHTQCHAIKLSERQERSSIAAPRLGLNEDIELGASKERQPEL
jgi:hypothetical protein